MQLQEGISYIQVKNGSGPKTRITGSSLWLGTLSNTLYNNGYDILATGVVTKGNTFRSDAESGRASRIVYKYLL
jgi:hypothetical protein